MPEPRSRRRTFGPVVLLGLAGSGAAALAGTKFWAEPVAGPGGDSATLSMVEVTGTLPGDVPLAGALALVTLAAWGVILVTRQTARRVAAALAGLAALGVLATIVHAWFTLPDDVVDAVEELGAEGIEAHWTWWPWIALAGSLAALVGAVLAFRFAPAWPEMGRKYDAPAVAAAGSPAGAGGAGNAATEVPPEEQSSLDLWKALDQGTDPTDSHTDTPPPAKGEQRD